MEILKLISLPISNYKTATVESEILKGMKLQLFMTLGGELKSHIYRCGEKL